MLVLKKYFVFNIIPRSNPERSFRSQTESLTLGDAVQVMSVAYHPLDYHFELLGEHQSIERVDRHLDSNSSSPSLSNQIGEWKVFQPHGCPQCKSQLKVNSLILEEQDGEFEQYFYEGDEVRCMSCGYESKIALTAHGEAYVEGINENQLSA